jgi:hypothetical protein
MSTLPPAGSSEDDARMHIDARREDERTLFVLGRPVPIAKGVVRPAVTWEAVAPGLVFPMLEYIVTRSAVEWYYDSIVAPFGGRIAAAPEAVPPLFFADEPMQCVNTIFARSGRLHAGHLIEAYRAVTIGSLVRSSATVSARYQRSDKSFYEVDCVTSIAGTERDEPAIRIRATFVI